MSNSKEIIFKKDSNRKQVQCTICNCWLPSAAEKFIESHLNGRKHKQQLEKKEHKEKVLQCSVYVKGFNSLLERLEEELIKYFELFQVKVADIYVDKNKAGYAIVEFQDQQAVDLVLNADKPLFHGETLTVRRRELKKAKHVSNEESVISSEEKLCFLPLELVEMLSTTEKLSEQMKILQHHFQLSDEDLQLRTLLCDLILNVLEELYPGCQVLLFGSSANGLGVKGCDVDMTLLTNDVVVDDIAIMREVREVVQRFAPGCKNVSLIETSKTCPIVKFYHTESCLNVDLSLNNRLALTNTRLLRMYMKIDSRVPTLTYTLRAWLKYNQLNGRTTTQLNNYTLTLMVIYFLQQVKPAVLPCLQSDKSLKPHYIDPWNCAFLEETHFSTSNTSSAGGLLLGFFKFFATFDFKTYGIAINNASLITRKQCSHAAECASQGQQLNIETPILVQDPFKLSHNVAQNLGMEGFTILHNKIKRASNLSDLTCEDKAILQKLFTTEKDCTKRIKQKQKRNRSNVYSVSLPNCSHACGSSPKNCYAYVKKVLVDDLRMQLRAPSPSVKASSSTCSDKVENLTSSQATGTKRRHSETKQNETEQSSCKKLKIDQSAMLEYRVVAYEDTWTNRRRQRRIELQSNEKRSNLPEECKVEISESCVSAVNSNGKSSCTSVGDVLNFSPPKQQEELFQFDVCITKASNRNDVCKIVFQPIDCSQNLLQFQTFFAYCKKELVTVFK